MPKRSGETNAAYGRRLKAELTAILDDDAIRKSRRQTIRYAQGTTSARSLSPQSPVVRRKTLSYGRRRTKLWGKSPSPPRRSKRSKRRTKQYGVLQAEANEHKRAVRDILESLDQAGFGVNAKK
jgi:hypothetical protein